jgi:hypothetical protein
MKFTVILLSFLFLQCKNSQPLNSSDSITHTFRFKPGQDLKQEIESFVIKEDIKAGWIIKCAGSLTSTNLRIANQTECTKANGHFEILSLVGTISTNGSHLNLSISDSLGNTTGVHLLEGNPVYTTAEIVIGESEKLVFSRESDGSTKWQ